MKFFLSAFSYALLILLTMIPFVTFSNMNILPSPKEVRQLDGVFQISDATQIVLPESAPTRLLLAAHELASMKSWGLGTEECDSCISLEIVDSPIIDGKERDGYTLSIKSDEIRVIGNSESGLFYGIKTLQKIVEQRDTSSIPAVEILDEPDFENRGFYHDITRGKVPTLDTMKEIVDFLADHKANQFQLYVEHTFAFSFDPRIAHNPDGLTAAEILELDAYCADRYIDLVPSLQSYGHLAGLLSIPEYREFAEIETYKQWDEITWHERMVGATLDTTNPEARALMKRMLDEYLPLFRSKFVNVCADETYDAGKGKGEKYAESLGGSGYLYLEHIEWLNEVCKSHGKRMMFWGDIVKKHPDLISEIPKDTILLNWGYWYKTDFESSKLFQDAGLDYYVCPGVSGWNEILNRMENADINIRKYIETGKKYGAIGVLNTDWGDHGHYNLLAGSWHGIALGASMSWNSDGPDQDQFDEIFSATMFGDPSGDGVKALRDLAFDVGHYGSWKCFYPSMNELEAVEKLSDEEAEALISKSKETLEIFNSYHEKSSQNLSEYKHMIQMMGMLGQKALLVRELKENDGKKNTTLSKELNDFANSLEVLSKEYQRLWLARNKNSELHEIVEKLDILIMESQTFASGLGAES